jgi:hypothetical protein
MSGRQNKGELLHAERQSAVWYFGCHLCILLWDVELGFKLVLRCGCMIKTIVAIVEL